MPTRTVLVVEDDPNDEHLTLRALAQSGVPCTVVVAHSSAEALDFLNRTGPFDSRTGPDPLAIFVDNTLPGKGGSDLIGEIRSIPHLAAIPVVVLSGSLDMKVVDKCFQAGANSFLLKPVDMGDYMKQVNSAAHYWLTLNLTPHSPHGKASVL